MKRLVCVFSFMVKINKKIAPVELQPICYWMPRDRNTLYLVVQQCPLSSASSDTAESIITPLQTQLPSALIWPEHFSECHLNFLKLSLPFVNIQPPADIFPYCLTPFRHFRDPHFMYSHLLLLSWQGYGLINVCVWEILWARFLHWRSFQFCLALTGAGRSPALISVVQLTGCWRRDTGNGSPLPHSDLFLSRYWVTLHHGNNCFTLLVVGQYCSDWAAGSHMRFWQKSIFQVDIHEVHEVWSVLWICLCYSVTMLLGRSRLYK